MLKAALLKLIEAYDQNRGYFILENMNITLLKKFLSTDGIIMLNDSDNISFNDFKTYLEDQCNQNKKDFNQLYLRLTDKKYLLNKKQGGSIFLSFMEAEDRNIENKSTLDMLPEEMKYAIYSHLAPKDISQLGATSSLFYTELKGPDYWSDKLIAAGCDRHTLDELKQTGLVQDYKKLYQGFMRAKAYFAAYQIPINVNHLLCLSGQAKALKHVYDVATTQVKSEDPLAFSSNDVLFYAALSGHISAIQFAIAPKPQGLQIDPKIRDESGQNALHFAAMSGSIAAMEFVIDPKGLDINYTDVDNIDQTILHFAARSGSKAAMLFAANLLKKYDSTNMLVDELGHTPLHFAAQSGSVAAMQFAVEPRPKGLGIDPKLLDNRGNNVLYYAVKSGSLEVVQFAMKPRPEGLGIDPKSKNYKNQDAFFYAKQSKNSDELLQILLNKAPGKKVEPPIRTPITKKRL